VATGICTKILADVSGARSQEILVYIEGLFLRILTDVDSEDVKAEAGGLLVHGPSRGEN
jgi:hypothetical protein